MLAILNQPISAPAPGWPEIHHPVCQKQLRSLQVNVSGFRSIQREPLGQPMDGTLIILTWILAPCTYYLFLLVHRAITYSPWVFMWNDGKRIFLVLFYSWPILCHGLGYWLVLFNASSTRSTSAQTAAQYSLVVSSKMPGDTCRGKPKAQNPAE